METNMVLGKNIQNQSKSIVATKTKSKTICFASGFELNHSRSDVEVHVYFFLLNSMFTSMRPTRRTSTSTSYFKYKLRPWPISYYFLLHCC